MALSYDCGVEVDVQDITTLLLQHPSAVLAGS
jgi:hypothetical protein